MISVFKSLPKKGKLKEVVTRIILVIVAPFVYLAHFFASFFGRPVSANEPRPFPLTYEVGNARERVESISDQAQEVIQEAIRDTFQRNQLDRVKLLITCRVEDREENHELNFASLDGHLAAQNLHESVTRKFAYIKSRMDHQMSRVGERGHVRIMFKGFFQIDHGLLVKDWSINDIFDEGHFVRIPVEGSHVFGAGRWGWRQGLTADFNDLQVDYPGFDDLEAFFDYRVFG